MMENDQTLRSGVVNIYDMDIDLCDWYGLLVSELCRLHATVAPSNCRPDSNPKFSTYS